MTTTATAVHTPYGSKAHVEYADPGYRDATARYPIDTPEHVRAAWAYINMPKNAEPYTAKQLELIKHRIMEAAKKYGIEIAARSDQAASGTTAVALENVDEGSLVAGAGPLAPPAQWFANPGLTGPTKLTIDEDGHVFGHLAQWRVCHVGIGNACVMAPHSRTNYNLFKVGTVVASDGSQIPVGKIVLGTAHANAQYGVMPTRDHYDNTGMSAAVVNVGEDKHGIWVNGALTSTITPEKIAELRASALSGDWRAVNGNLELIAALAVNSPGFPIYRENAGRAFSLQAVGVLGTDDDVSGEFSVGNGDGTETIDLTDEQQERMSRLSLIEEDLEQHDRAQRLAQLAALDEADDAPDHKHHLIGFNVIDPEEYYADDESDDEE